MFKRREPHPWHRLVREMFWPSMGWRRAYRYVKLRIVRISDTSHKIAAGLALGVAISFSPLLGTHFIQVGLIGWLFRFNILAGLVGTFFGNPWTFPFIWWGSIELGAYLFGIFGFDTARALPERIDFMEFWNLLTHEPVRIFLPWMLGGYILAFLVWFPTYFVFYHLVKGAKAARARARLRKVHKVAVEVTGQQS